MYQQPLGSRFKSYELTAASNYWTLDPFQYSITKFKFNLPSHDPAVETGITVNESDFKNDPGLVYKQVDFEKLLPSYTSEKKSVNDFPAQSYHRFQANEGYFNPNEGTDNTDLWYYGATGGAALNVQEPNHIIFPEPQRGGLNSQSVARYSSVSTTSSRIGDSIKSWEEENFIPVKDHCKLFSYNDRYSADHESKNLFDKVYSFDTEYCRSIGILSLK